MRGRQTGKNPAWTTFGASRHVSLALQAAYTASGEYQEDALAGGDKFSKDRVNPHLATMTSIVASEDLPTTAEQANQVTGEQAVLEASSNRT